MYAGIRYTDHEYEIGEKINHCSNVWVDNEMTDEKLPGICTIGIADDYDAESDELSMVAKLNDEWNHVSSDPAIVELARKVGIYGKRHAYIIIGDYVADGEDGDDFGEMSQWREMVMDNAQVLRKLW